MANPYDAWLICKARFDIVIETIAETLNAPGAYTGVFPVIEVRPDAQGEPEEVEVDAPIMPVTWDAPEKGLKVAWIEAHKSELIAETDTNKCAFNLFIRVGNTEDARRYAIYGNYAIDDAASEAQITLSREKAIISYGENNDSVTVMIGFQEQ